MGVEVRLKGHYTAKRNKRLPKLTIVGLNAREFYKLLRDETLAAGIELSSVRVPIVLT